MSSTRKTFRIPTLIAAASGLVALSISVLGAGPAGAAPTSNLVFSVDGGTTWSANVTAAPGQTVIAREYYDNDTDATIDGTSLTTALPSGFSLVPGTTQVCLNPGTTDPTSPSSELECNTNTGGTPPNDQGGAIDEAAVWSGPNLAISPTAGLFGQPTNQTVGPLAEGKVKYINLDNCLYIDPGVDTYTTFVNSVPNPPYDAGTNASDTATAAQCAAGSSPYAPQGNPLQNIDLLGQAWFNFEQCSYSSSALGDSASYFESPITGTSASNTDDNPTNSTSTAPTCAASGGGYVLAGVNSGIDAMDLLDNQYVNLDDCDYNNSPATGHDNFTIGVNIANGSGLYSAGTHASNTPQTANSCGAGNPAGYEYIAGNGGLQVLNTLDTTRGQGFVQWSMTAPSPATTTTYTEDGQLSGAGTGDPTTSGTITIDASVGTPLGNPWVLGGGVGLLGLASISYLAIARRRRTEDHA